MSAAERPTTYTELADVLAAMPLLAREKCVECQWGQCPGGSHPWADEDDVAHALSIGQPDSAKGECGCPCTKGPARDVWLERDDDDPVISLNAEPCRECGADGPCAYDGEGRPLIHAQTEHEET